MTVLPKPFIFSHSGLLSPDFNTGENGEWIQRLQEARNSKLYAPLRFIYEPERRGSSIAEVTALKKCVGTMLDVPDLVTLTESHIMPKRGFEGKFFLSQQRYDILYECVTVMDSPSGEGMVFSAGHGVGKSALCYFLACFHFVNSSPLLYIVRPVPLWSLNPQKLTLRCSPAVGAGYKQMIRIVTS